MDLPTRVLRELAARQAPAPAPAVTGDAGEKLLELLANPFASQVQVTSVWSALGVSVGVTAGVALLFSLMRPHNSIVYAPKMKHADDEHAPPPLGKGIFSWLGPLWKTNEDDLVRLAGLDAAVFMRFTLMCRNIFLVLSVLGCSILLPVYLNKSAKFGTDLEWVMTFTPLKLWGEPYWALVAVGWLFNLVICGFLWWNYRKILQLRRTYFESPGYQSSLHARTLMLIDIPKKLGTDEGIARIIDNVAPSSSFSRTAVARNVKILPQLISQHEQTVRQLEQVLAKYLKDPQNLPAERPKCEPSKKDRSYGTYAKGQKVDAIEYLTERIKQLELEIKEVRSTIDKRNTMSYGFASYSDISETHSIAYAARKKKPQGAIIRLAPRPNDIIWDNMPLSPATRSRRRFINNMWITLLTLAWIAPNAMIAIFLVNLSNLGSMWEGFQKELQNNKGFWGVVQGVGSPALMSGIYLLLPIIFRRLSMQAGDQTKSGRERHVIAKLYSFFVFNNLIIFSLFGAIWKFVTGVIKDTGSGLGGWDAIVKQNPGDLLLGSLCSISPFWITWLLQRQLGTAIDLAQLWPLMWGFLVRKLSNPTPRELIELTAPPPIDYAPYYNYFLFYSTVALCYAPIQPLCLPACAVFFVIDVVLRKYLIMYVLVTKTESGGMAWRVLFNRFIFGTILSNLIMFLVIFIRGNADHLQAFAVAPLPFIMIGFKVYCSKAFDTKIHYYTTRNVAANHEANVGGIAGKENLRSDRLAARFGHPALYKPLITPMVHAKAQNILASVYSGRLTAGREAGSGDSSSVSGYSDTYALDHMHKGQPGKVKGSGVSMPGFEVVPESKLDFEFYKNRAEFAEDHGGGEIYGTQGEIMRPNTPGSMFDSRPGTPVGGLGARRAFSPGPGMGPYGGHETGTAYTPGYNLAGTPSPPIMAYPGQVQSPGRVQSPGPLSGGYNSPHVSSPYGHGQGFAAPPPQQTRSASGIYGMGQNESESNLVSHAAPMTRTSTRDPSMDRTPGMFGGGPRGYGNLPQEEHDQVQDPMSYDYFRGGSSNRRTPGPGN